MLRSLAVQTRGMAMEGKLAGFGIQALEGVANGGMDRRALPVQLAQSVQAFTVSIHESLDLSVRGRARDHGQDAEQQKVS
nr:hypothetical protein [Nitrococcus mobilis]